MSSIVYFDSCVFLAWLKDEPGRANTVEMLFDECKNNNLRIHTSTLTIAEVLDIQGFRSPIPKGDRAKVKKLFANDWIVTTGVNRRIAETAQELVWNDGVKPKDAIHVATSILRNVPYLYSYDTKLTGKKLIKIKDGEVKISEPQPPKQGKLEF